MAGLTNFSYSLAARPDRLTSYFPCVKSGNSESYGNTFDENFKIKGVKGVLSPGAIKRIREVMSWFDFILASTRTKPVFITLTLPSRQKHSDYFLKRVMLEQFLSEVRRYFGVKLYIWKAETQKNGNLHFHIIADKFCPWLLIRKMWNRILNKEGYVDVYADKHKNLSFSDYLKLYPSFDKKEKRQRLKAYKFGVRTKWKQPNSTDIHDVKHVHNLQSYLLSYMVGEDKGTLYNCIDFEGGKSVACQEPETWNIVDQVNYIVQVDGSYKRLPATRCVQGKIWGCSECLKLAKNADAEITGPLEDEMIRIEAEFYSKRWDCDYATCFFVKIIDIPHNRYPVIWDMINEQALNILQGSSP